MDKRPLFAAVKETRELSKQAGILDEQEGKVRPSNGTLEQYKRIMARDWNSGKKPMEGVSRASWFVHRAALLTGYRELFREAMQKQDEAQKRGDVEQALELVRKAKEAVERWMAVQTAQRPEEGPQRQSKRSQIPKAKDWRAKVHEAARPNEKAAIAVLWATGLRPIELEMGADVWRERGNIFVRIPGAKVSKAVKGGTGQKWRVIEIDPKSDAGKALEATLDEDGLADVQMGTRVLEAALERLGEELRHKHTLSGYTFRHQLGADLKAWGDPELTAGVLGHQSERTQSRYGSSSQAKGGGKRWVMSVETTKAIRGHRTDKRFEKTNRMEGPGF